MPSVRIVTDSGADLPRELQQALNIHVVPLTVHFGSEEYLDGVDLSAETFYDRLGGPVMPRTTQPSPADFERVYRQLVEQGYSIVSVHLSGRLSGTVQSATLAAQEVGGDIHVVDSQAASMGIGLLAVFAARQAEEGLSASAIADGLRSLRQRLFHIFTVDTLEFLQRNGRIGKAQAFVGSLLNVKPILTLRDGVVHPLERARGRANAVARLVEHVSSVIRGRRAVIAVVHGNVPREAEMLAERLQSRLELAECIIALLGPTVGTHVGPGALGVVGYVFD